MKKILFVVNDPDFFLSHRLPIACACRKEGYDVHVATPPGPGAEIITRCGFLHHPFQLDRSRARPWRELATVLQLWLLYRRLKPDIVHHVTLKPVLYGSIAARLARIEAVVNAVSGLGYIFIARGIKAGIIRTAVKFAYRIACCHPNQRIIFQNPDDWSVLVDSGLIRVNDAVMIKGSGADMAVFVPTPEPKGLPIVVMPARLLWDKGVREFVEAAVIVKESGVAARFVLVGAIDAGNPTSVPRAWIEAAVESGAVEWWGKREDMAEVFSKANIVCLASYREGLPKALVEAAAAGRAIVSTDVPGCRDIVIHGHNGLLVPSRDSDSLAKALSVMLLDREMRLSMGRQGRDMVEKEFSLDYVLRETMQIYRELVGSEAESASASFTAVTRAG